jgi:hypothetical protein
MEESQGNNRVTRRNVKKESRNTTRRIEKRREAQREELGERRRKQLELERIRQQAQTAELTNDILCSLAQSDLRHDFSVSDIEKYGAFSIPPSAACAHMDEDKTLETLLGITREEDGESKGLFKNTVGPMLTEEYVYNMRVPYSKLYESGFNYITPTGDIFLVVDTFTEGMKTALANLKELGDQDSGPTLYWVQNRQTLYDPAGKSTPHTRAGREMMDSNERVTFCWEDTSDTCFFTAERYPIWPIGVKYKSTNPVAIDRDHSDTNTLFYSRDDINMVLLSDENDPSYELHESVGIFDTNDPKERNQAKRKPTVIMTKEMASRQGVQFSIGTYPGMAKVLSDVLNSRPLFASQETKKIMETIDAHHVAAKRLGDQGQALSCLNVGQTYRYHDPKSPSSYGSIQMNGLNCFVTIDRVAMCGALLYRAPIVLFQYDYEKEKGQENSVALFIRKDLLSEEIQEQHRKAALKRKWEALRDDGIVAINKYDGAIQEVKRILNDNVLSNLEAPYVEQIKHILEGEVDVIHELVEQDNRKKCEKLYQEWIMSLYRYVPKMKKITTCYTDAKNKIVDNIGRIEQKIADYKASYSELKTYMEDVMPLVPQNQMEENYKPVNEALHKLYVKTEEINNLSQGIINFSSTCEVIKQTNTREPDIEHDDKKDIVESNLYTQSSYSERAFRANAPASTLSEQLKEIKNMLITIGIYEEYKIHFTNILAEFMKKGWSFPKGEINQETYYIFIVHLQKAFPELLVHHPDLKEQLIGPSRGGSQSRNRTTHHPLRSLQMALQSLYNENVLRSVFAILYSLWSVNVQRTLLPIRNSKKQVMTRDEVHEILLQLYNKFIESSVSDDEEPTIVKEDDNDNVDPYRYYIPYIERQVKDTKNPGLLAMYQNLLHDIIVDVPSDIEQLLREFLQDGVTYDSFFNGQILQAPKAVKNVPVERPWLTTTARPAISVYGGHPLKHTRKQRRKQKRAKTRGNKNKKQAQ